MPVSSKRDKSSLADALDGKPCSPTPSIVVAVVTVAAGAMARLLREREEPQLARLASALIPGDDAFVALRLLADCCCCCRSALVWYDAVRRRGPRTLDIRPSPGDSASIGVEAGGGIASAGGLIATGVSAVVGVPFTVEGPEEPFWNGGIRPDDSLEVVEIRDALEPGRRGEPCFRDVGSACGGDEILEADAGVALGGVVGKGKGISIGRGESVSGGGSCDGGDAGGGTNGVAIGEGVRVSTGEC